jgi:hypothetical protein
MATLNELRSYCGMPWASATAPSRTGWLATGTSVTSRSWMRWTAPRFHQPELLVTATRTTRRCSSVVWRTIPSRLLCAAPVALLFSVAPTGLSLQKAGEEVLADLEEWAKQRHTGYHDFGLRFRSPAYGCEQHQFRPYAPPKKGQISAQDELPLTPLSPHAATAALLLVRPILPDSVSRSGAERS